MPPAGAPGGAGAGLPTVDDVGVGRWQAPAGWRAIDFISDLHLAASLPQTTAALDRYLAGPDADAVVILGDLFEAWVGDDAAALPYESAVVAMLARCAAARPVLFMPGNRDFLVGDPLLRATGIHRLTDPTCLDAWGHRMVLAHGDALCLDDADYQAFRRLVRDPPWQQAFLRRPLADRLAIAADLRQRSTGRGGFDNRPDSEPDPAACRTLLDACGAATLLHGHTHRPGTVAIDADHRRVVLGDWDLDDPRHPRAEVLRLTPHGIARLDPAAAASRTP